MNYAEAFFRHVNREVGSLVAQAEIFSSNGDMEDLRDAFAIAKRKCERLMDEYPQYEREYARLSNTCSRWYDSL